MSGVDPETRAFYDRDAADYATRGNVLHKIHPTLDVFATRLPAGGRVLDLGCGGGQHSAALVAKGFAVTSIDPSPGLAAEAKRLWNVDVVSGSFDELDYDSVFDGVWAAASLHHAQTSALPGIFARIRSGASFVRWMRKRSWAWSPKAGARCGWRRIMAPAMTA
jgi:SAM-dependent methyltransferase